MTKSPRNFLGIIVVVIFAALAFFYRNEILYLVGAVRSFDYEELQALELENKALRSELNELREEKNIISDSYLRAKVYSRYPFNNHRLIIVNLGEADGVRVGMPVLAREGVLLGRVKSVFGRQSVVETVFDPAWRSSVIIGPEKVKALVEGGVTPSLTLITKGSVISPKDAVLNTSPEFPLGLFLGEVGEIKPTADDIWLTAGLKPLYEPEGFTEVLIVVNFP